MSTPDAKGDAALPCNGTKKMVDASVQVDRGGQEKPLSGANEAAEDGPANDNPNAEADPTSDPSDYETADHDSNPEDDPNPDANQGGDCGGNEGEGNNGPAGDNNDGGAAVDGGIGNEGNEDRPAVVDGGPPVGTGNIIPNELAVGTER